MKLCAANIQLLIMHAAISLKDISIVLFSNCVLCKGHFFMCLADHSFILLVKDNLIQMCDVNLQIACKYPGHS